MAKSKTSTMAKLRKKKATRKGNPATAIKTAPTVVVTLEPEYSDIALYSPDRKPTLAVLRASYITAANATVDVSLAYNRVAGNLKSYFSTDCKKSGLLFSEFSNDTVNEYGIRVMAQKEIFLDACKAKAKAEGCLTSFNGSAAWKAVCEWVTGKRGAGANAKRGHAEKVAIAIVKLYKLINRGDTDENPLPAEVLTFRSTLQASALNMKGDYKINKREFD